MNPFMVFQIASCGKCFTTVLVGASEWLLTRMSPLVDNETLGGEKRFTAGIFWAFELPIIAVEKIENIGIYL